jgi:hypothetical protein
MTRQTNAPLQSTSFTATNRSARELVNLVNEGDMTISEEYQRGDAWTLDQQIALIRSWMTGVPIPAIVVNDRMGHNWQGISPAKADGYAYSCIDGRQRVSAAIAWFTGNLAVPASWFNPEDVHTAEDTEDGPYVRYTGLSRPAQLVAAFQWTMPVAEAKLPTVQAEAEVFLLVNGGGTPQSDADMARAARIAGRE